MKSLTDRALLRKARTACKRANKVLYLLTYLFPKEKRAPTLFLYYYFRGIDDEIDKKGLTETSRMKTINYWRKRMEGLFEGKLPNDMNDKDRALYNFIQYDPKMAEGIKPQIGNIFDIMEFDSKNRNKLVSYEDLIHYCYLTGGAPFIIALSLLDQRVDETTKENIAQTLGVGIQLAHILRDFKEDLRLKDAKITTTETVKFNLLGSNLKNVETWRQFAIQRVEEAAKFLDDGRRYIKEIPSNTLKFSLALWRWKYLSILKKIQLRDYDLMSNYKKTKPRELFASLSILVKELSYVVVNIFKPRRASHRPFFVK
ncbi:MAG: squalene/phytoene synthase family protein [Candidatus Aenigmatarchaeota archaeon]